MRLKKYSIFIFLMFFIFMSCSKYKISYKEAYKLKQLGDVESLKESLNKFNDSIRYATMALHGKFEALKVLGLKLIQMEMYLEAAKYFDEAKKIEPTDAKVHYFLGLCYANYAKIEKEPSVRRSYINKAEASYLSGIEADAEHAINFYALGILYGFLKEDTENGIKYLRQSLAKEKRNTDALFAIANLHYRRGEEQAAISYYQKIMNYEDPDSPKWQKASENIKEIRLTGQY